MNKITSFQFFIIAIVVIVIYYLIDWYKYEHYDNVVPLNYHTDNKSMNYMQINVPLYDENDDKISACHEFAHDLSQKIEGGKITNKQAQNEWSYSDCDSVLKPKKLQKNHKIKHDKTLYHQASCDELTCNELSRRYKSNAINKMKRKNCLNEYSYTIDYARNCDKLKKELNKKVQHMPDQSGAFTEDAKNQVLLNHGCTLD